MKLIDMVERQAEHIAGLRNAIFEAHALLCFTYQVHMLPPSQTDGRYEESMRVWNLDPKAREMMTACEQALYDELMKLQPPAGKLN